MNLHSLQETNNGFQIRCKKLYNVFDINNFNYKVGR
ncbi:hypothetical protein EZS27_017202 [termite gut metagenome]|uniref:Uncharacterized protein n=1 Tax=termite gut metagenome TaxID=433724 RepID=A0A5J4RKP7_9ZZZZ